MNHITAIKAIDVAIYNNHKSIHNLQYTASKSSIIEERSTAQTNINLYENNIKNLKEYKKFLQNNSN